jgi:hypothetical protein
VTARVLAAVGSLTMAGALVLATLLLFHVQKAWRGDQPATHFTSQADCRSVDFDSTAPYLMAMNRSGAATVTLTAREPSACTMKVELVAAAPLKVSGKNPDDITLTIERPTDTRRWILSADQAGTWDIEVKAGGFRKPYTIEVTTVFGLSPLTTALIAGVSGVMGPMLTLPYWLERWRTRPATRRPGRRK